MSGLSLELYTFTTMDSIAIETLDACFYDDLSGLCSLGMLVAQT
jgi:hypothetical protein